MRLPALLLLLPWGRPAAAAPGSEQIAPAPAYYPRLATLQPGAFAGAVLEAPTPTQRRLLFLPRSPTTRAWGPAALVAAAPTDPATDVDLANPHLLQLPNGTLLCAYRHHFTSSGSARTYTLQLSASSDQGATWQAAATITSGATGVWEPYLFLAAGGALRVAYAAELTNGGEQDIVLRSSRDGGGTWGDIDSRLHTPGSRNGMPGLQVLPQDGSLLLVCEGFWGAGGWGAFTVNSARSLDGGATWQQRQVVHAPAPPADAGSPQVALCSSAGGALMACASFMSNENGGAAVGAAAAAAAWPDGAQTMVLCAPVNGSAPIAWHAAGQPRVVATATRDTYWPSFFTGAGGLALGLAYQGSDSAAYFLEGSVC